MQKKNNNNTNKKAFLGLYNASTINLNPDYINV